MNQDMLKEHVHYDHETGIFTWIKTNSNRVKVGSQAGSILRGKYIRIMVNGYVHLAHRLAWLYVYGEFPILDIDHINRNGKDNRIANLRLAHQYQNSLNVGLSKRNTSGHKGVNWDKERGKWLVRVTQNYKGKNLGRYDSIEEARKAYREFVQKSHGEFYVGDDALSN